MSIFTKTIHHHHTETKLVPFEKNVNIKEERAPTDLSIQLLNEFQEKAKENIIKSLRISDNTLNSIVVYYRSNIPENMLEVHVRFKLNGREYLIKTDVYNYDINKSKQAAGGIAKIVFETIAKEIVKSFFEHNDDFVSYLNNI